MKKTLESKGVQLPLADNGAWSTLPTPKIRNRTSDGVFGWAHAYAGFSYEFAAESVRMLKTSGTETFLDPFVGSGTSALAAAQEGVPFWGIDIDPFSALLTRAKLATDADEKKVHAYLKTGSRKILTSFTPQSHELFNEADLKYATCVFNRLLSANLSDPRELWNRFLNDPKGKYDSEIVALACIAISSRGSAKVVRGSNPVWLKKSLKGEISERPPLRTVTQEFVTKMLQDLSITPSGIRGPSTRIMNCGFQNAVIRNKSIDCIITSPPYLNRLDYIINHLPEISILSGFLPTEIEELRRRMMGTTKMTGNGDPSPDWGPACRDLLEQIRNHPSKASGTYYYRFHYQYFDTLKAIFNKLREVCKKNARGLLVVQDSYYKDIRIPLIEIMREMGKETGINISEIRTEHIRGHMGTISPAQKTYVPTKILKEHVLLLDF